MRNMIVLFLALALQGCAVMINVGNDAGMGGPDPTVLDTSRLRLCKPDVDNPRR